MIDSKKTLSGQIEDQLYNMIVAEERFGPGEKLPNENELSDTLGISRTTLREAIRSLVAQGILEVRRGKGTYIAEDLQIHNGDLGFKSLERIQGRLKDLFEIRLVFEPEVTYFACKRATDAEIADILQKGKYEEELIRTGQGRIEADLQFHKSIVLASHNEFMIRLIPMINNAISAAIQSTSNSETLSQITLKDHSLIMDFLESRDAKGAKYAMMLHLHHAMRFLNITNDNG